MDDTLPKGVRKVVSWFFQLVAAVILLQTLWFKFGGSPESVHIFETVGMEPWGRYGTGFVEGIAALLLLIPRTAWLGALLALGVICGAVFFHLTSLGIEVMGDGGTLFYLALTVLLSSLVVLYLHRRRIPGVGDRKG